MTSNFDIPIFQKSYDLFKTLHSLQDKIPKTERYTVWQKAQNINLEILEGLLQASNLEKDKRSRKLELVSCKLDMLRVFIRLSFDTKIIDQKKYILIQSIIDEIGRMLGGWIKNLKIEHP